MDTEFPKIEFDIFNFAIKHECMVRIRYNDYSFTDSHGDWIANGVLYVDVVKNGCCRHIAFNRELLSKSKDAGFVIEAELKEALEYLRKEYWNNVHENLS